MNDLPKRESRPPTFYGYSINTLPEVVVKRSVGRPPKKKSKISSNIQDSKVRELPGKRKSSTREPSRSRKKAKITQEAGVASQRRSNAEAQCAWLISQSQLPFTSTHYSPPEEYLKNTLRVKLEFAGAKMVLKSFGTECS
jgi:hypothetical protein